jgi:Domain of unknown function (DUF4190)
MSDYSTNPLPPSAPMPVPSTSPQTSTMAIISLIGGITGFSVLPMLGSLAAIIFGHIAKNEIKKSGGRIGGNGMATAGLIMGYGTIGLGLCGLCIWLGFFVILPLILAAVGMGSSYNY